jgi:cytochrome o ubiquinol oxidase subunit 2
MNAFYVPALAGMIYAMPGMTSQLNAVINVAGEYEGFSSNYSGHGFSKMRFGFHGLSQADFDVWLAKVRLGDGGVLDRARYLDLALPTEGVPPMGFEDVDPDLFRRIVNRCVEEGRLCMDQMMALDAAGGTGLAGTINTIPAERRQASALGHEPFYVAEFCSPAESVAQYGAGGVVLLDPPPVPAGARTDETL